MKLKNYEVKSFFKNPNQDFSFALIYGSNSVEVSRNCKIVSELVAGPTASEEMRIEEFSNDFIKKNPGVLENSVKSLGFFSGKRLVVVKDTTDAITNEIEACIKNWTKDDANIILTAGALSTKSSLRKLAEACSTGYSLPVYENPLTLSELKFLVNDYNINIKDSDLLLRLLQYQQLIEINVFRNLLEKLALYKNGDKRPVSLKELTEIFSDSEEFDEYDAVNFMTNGEISKLLQSLKKLEDKKVSPTNIVIRSSRNFLTLHKLKSHPQGVEFALNSNRPPIFGERKKIVKAQLSNWSVSQIEKALTMLSTLDKKIRSSSKTPSTSLVERDLIKIAQLTRKKA